MLATPAIATIDIGRLLAVKADARGERTRHRAIVWEQYANFSLRRRSTLLPIAHGQHSRCALGPLTGPGACAQYEMLVSTGCGMSHGYRPTYSARPNAKGAHFFGDSRMLLGNIAQSKCLSALGFNPLPLCLSCLLLQTICDSIALPQSATGPVPG